MIDSILQVVTLAEVNVQPFLSRCFEVLDDAVGRLLVGKWWYFRVAAAALLIGFLVHIPPRSGLMTRQFFWPALVLRQQVDHPLTPINPWKFRPADSNDIGVAEHLDKLAFRLTIPVLGKLSGTGSFAWVLFPALAGLAFYPLLARQCGKWIGDRQVAAYLTMAFAVSWTGGQFFGDGGVGDGVAWFLLLLSVSCGAPVAIFLSVLAAAFTDERGLIATGGTFLFWAWDTRLFRDPIPQDTPRFARGSGRQWGAVLVAWIVYFGSRFYLGRTYGLTTGKSMIYGSEIFFLQITQRFPYVAFDTFKCLWIWIPLGLVSLMVARRWLAAVGYAAIALVLLAISLVVLDLERTLGYALILFPLAWRTEALPLRSSLVVSRLCFLFGVALFVPWETPLRYVRFLLPSH